MPIDNLWPEIEKRAAQLAPSIEAAKTALPEGIALAGAGFCGELACRTIKEQGGKVSFFADNNPMKQGGECAGVRIVSLEDLARKNPEMTLITAKHAVLAVARQLDALGIAHLSYDAFFAEQHLERLQAVRNKCLTDERSRAVFDGVLLSMLSGDPVHCKAVMDGDQYFVLPEFVNNGGGHYVDAGAYVGDTVERFLWAHNGMFTKIHAFEPGPKQFAALETRIKRLASEWAFEKDSCACIQAGLGDKEEEKLLTHPPGVLVSSSFSDGAGVGTRIPIVTLDNYLQGRPVTFIKADIEGMEMPMLRGAARTISQYKPNMAISIYHKPHDLFAIPEYIKSLVPNYQMAVRHHSPMLVDTVLYCWMSK